MKASSPDITTIVYTTDVHGSYFPYDFIKGVPTSGGLARVATVVDRLRSENTPDRLLILDDGDFLQGQPSAYYYNFIDTVTPHLAARIFNHIGYNAIGEGNHDIETGHAVYDRVASQLEMPTLAANVIDRTTGEPYFTPYLIQNVGSHKIAIIGLLTPAIPAWLPERLWSGLEFQE
ncbi:MAG: metallophosphoesterase, partial [Paramuribaculum sp.]|nr:metallophosphoesterase [Paramuribaculum sp.]